MPCSASVGTSGSSGERCGALTASARNLPARIWPMAEEVLSNIISTSPEMMSMCACELPL